MAGGIQVPNQATPTGTPRVRPSGARYAIASGDDRAVIVEVGADLRTLTLGGREVWLDRSRPYVMPSTGDVLPNVDRRSIAIEPMTCPPNAFQSGESVIRLEPGAAFSGTWVISTR